MAEGPFEPLDKGSLQAWTWKTSFLLAITPTVKVGKLQILDSHPQLPHCNGDRVVLRLNPAFLPKVSTPEHLSKEIVLEAFCLHPVTNLEQAL